MNRFVERWLLGGGGGGGGGYLDAYLHFHYNWKDEICFEGAIENKVFL